MVANSKLQIYIFKDNFYRNLIWKALKWLQIPNSKYIQDKPEKALPLTILLIASTVNARDMNKAKISSVDLNKTKQKKRLKNIKLKNTFFLGWVTCHFIIH